MTKAKKCLIWANMDVKKVFKYDFPLTITTTMF